MLARSREDGSLEAPSFSVQTRRSQRDVEVLKQSAEKKARAARETEKRAYRTASAARRLWFPRSRVRRRPAVAPTEANTTLFGQEVTKVSLGRRSSSAPRRQGNESVSQSRSASVFRRASGRVAESPHGMGRQYPDISVAGVLQKMSDQLGRDRWRRE